VRENKSKCPRVQRPQSLRACFLVATVILSLGIDAVAQDEIKLFNLTDISGHFSARYWFDEGLCFRCSVNPLARVT
jgi:hypothetical protein